MQSIISPVFLNETTSLNEKRILKKSSISAINSMCVSESQPAISLAVVNVLMEMFLFEKTFLNIVVRFEVITISKFLTVLKFIASCAFYVSTFVFV